MVAADVQRVYTGPVYIHTIYSNRINQALSRGHIMV